MQSSRPREGVSHKGDLPKFPVIRFKSLFFILQIVALIQKICKEPRVLALLQRTASAFLLK